MRFRNYFTSAVAAVILALSSGCAVDRATVLGRPVLDLSRGDILGFNRTDCRVTENDGNSSLLYKTGDGLREDSSFYNSENLLNRDSFSRNRREPILEIINFRFGPPKDKENKKK